MVRRRSNRWICNSYSNYDSVTAMQSDLGLRSLEQRRVDASVIMLYKIIHGVVAISLPVYFEQLSRQTRHLLAFRQIHTTANYYKYSPPLSIVYWNRLPAEAVMLPTLDQFSEAVQSLDHRLPQYNNTAVFNLFLNSTLAILTLSPFIFSLFLFLHLDFKSQSACT